MVLFLYVFFFSLCPAPASSPPISNIQPVDNMRKISGESGDDGERERENKEVVFIFSSFLL